MQKQFCVNGIQHAYHGFSDPYDELSHTIWYMGIANENHEI